MEKTISDIIRQGQENLDEMSNFGASNIGTILDNKYEIKREIARGGMGIVYEAYHKYTHQRVAIKVLQANQVEPRQLKSFQRELEAYSLLSHPNVITIHDAGVYNNYPYIVMEYIEGVDICTYVQQQEEKNRQEDAKNKSGKSKGRDWKLCARLIYETALGLEYIHSQKMFHRDIKPSNILVRPNGSPVIIDLGLVKFNRTKSYNLTRNGEIIGTIEYMPIEQTQGKKGKIDARTDVYSLGLVLYELLTGQKAYSGENLMELLYKIMLFYPPLPREIDSQIPEVLEEITIHATEKQKGKRYSSMKEFADALKHYLDGTTVKPTFQYPQMKQKLWIQRNKSKVIASCISILLVIGLVIILSMSWTTEFQRIRKSAEQGDAEAQYMLGRVYYDGSEEKQDDEYKQAFDWYKKAANQGHAKAQYMLGHMYKFGRGVKQDYKKACEWWEKVANQGHAKAQYMLGHMYYEGKGVEKDHKKAFEWFEKSATLRYIKAQYMLGNMYYEGKGVVQDIQKAVDWLSESAKQGHLKAQKDLEQIIKLTEKSAEQGDAEAQYMLGYMYYEGKGVVQDHKKAFEWFKKSAEQGDAKAQYMLGYMYYNGYGIERNIQKAVDWSSKSAKQGYGTAQRYLDRIVELTKQAAEQGNGWSQHLLGYIYKCEKLGKPFYEQAFYWYEKAAEQGIEESQFILGSMCKKGQGVAKDYVKACEWWEKAAIQGNAYAQYYLADMYYNGYGVEKNYAKACEWWEKAAKQDNAYAQNRLGDMYYYGYGVEKDIQKAREWWEKAAKQGNTDAKKRLKSLK